MNKLLDKCKEVCGARTDGELAKRLGISKQALSSYRNGHRLPDPVQCATIAGLSGMPLHQVIGIVGEARAISREEKAVWRKLAATAALLAIVLFPNLPAYASADRFEVGASIDGTEQAHGLCIMRSVRAWTARLARWLARQLIGGRRHGHLLAL